MAILQFHSDNEEQNKCLTVSSDFINAQSMVQRQRLVCNVHTDDKLYTPFMPWQVFPLVKVVSSSKHPCLVCSHQFATLLLAISHGLFLKVTVNKWQTPNSHSHEPRQGPFLDILCYLSSCLLSYSSEH